MDTEKINDNFSYHPPKNDQQKRYELLRQSVKNCALDINMHCPESREKALAMTNLEQAVMWANAAITRNE